MRMCFAHGRGWVAGNLPKQAWVPSYDNTRGSQGFDGDLAAEEASRMAMR